MPVAKPSSRGGAKKVRGPKEQKLSRQQEEDKCPANVREIPSRLPSIYLGGVNSSTKKFKKSCPSRVGGVHRHQSKRTRKPTKAPPPAVACGQLRRFLPHAVFAFVSPLATCDEHSMKQEDNRKKTRRRRRRRKRSKDKKGEVDFYKLSM